MKTEKEVETAIENQRKLCEEKGFPDFAPSDGMCFKCHRNIYQDYTYPGKDGLTLVTGCPHCNYSFCE